MPLENFKTIIDFAIEKEKQAVVFYEQLSEEESMSGVKEMFKDFAEDERKHQTYLENLERGNVDKNLANYSLEWIPDLKRSDYVVEMEYKRGMVYGDILKIAMKREEMALKLYNELLKKAETKESEKLLKILCQEEAKHKLVFETMYDDYMASMGD